MTPRRKQRGPSLFRFTSTTDSNEKGICKNLLIRFFQKVKSKWIQY